MTESRLSVEENAPTVKSAELFSELIRDFERQIARVLLALSVWEAGNFRQTVTQREAA